MALRKTPTSPDADLFRQELVNLINLRHPLVQLARNFLKGVEGDAINALLCEAGHNLRKILRKLRLLCAQ